MSIARKTVFIVAIPVLFEVLFLTMYLRSERQSAEHRMRQAHSTETALCVGRLLGLSNDAQSILRAYALAGDPALLGVFRRSIARLPLELQELQRLGNSEPADTIMDIPRKYRVEDVARVTAIVMQHLEEESALLAVERHAQVVAHLKDDAANNALDEFRKVARTYQGEELAEQRHEYEELKRLARVRKIQAITLTAGNSILALGLFWWLQRHVKERLRIVLRNMARYAAGEDVYRPEKSPDEIGRLDAQFHAMAAQLDAARRQLESRNDDLARLNVEKNHFMGMAAHDLRNPLFGALMSVEALLRRKELPERDRTTLQRVQKTLKGMSNLVSDFLDVSLIESGELRLRVAPADLAEIARECVETTQLLAEQKEIALQLDAPEPVIANVDQEKIAQVMTNFLTNAVKYSPSGGRVELAVTRTDHAARISVRDEGPGIPAEEMTRLFMPFSRTSTKPTAGETSTGLGLVICRKVVEGHGGRVWAESAVGNGSVFSFEVPLGE